MKKPDGTKKVLLTDHTEGQCRAIVGFKDGDLRAAYMCGEPVIRRPGKKQSSWCEYHHWQMHANNAEQNSAVDQAPRLSILKRHPSRQGP
ncbi:hypothetical protein [Bradyrhizobium sp. NAS96.2]|uniref:hypothetical protein n=1 Tax=Bradyrhizobium sp. NAS96.2 TaxID=1680160 RepID=UPI001160FEE9|nr:hypothetical protein [Bradyrhizobium sp. NAS96.2]